jgi:hypothetical protein
LGQIAHKLYDLVESYKGSKAGQKKIMPLLEKYYPGRYDKMSVEEFINLHNSKPIQDVYYFEVGCFSKFSPEFVDGWMDELGLEAQSDIYMPEKEVTDLNELRENLPPEEYEKVVEQMAGKFVKVDKKLQCGWLTLEQLYHIPTYSNKVTTSLQFMNGPGGVNAKKDEPILGKGRYRPTGQKIKNNTSLYKTLRIAGILMKVNQQYILKYII